MLMSTGWRMVYLLSSYILLHHNRNSFFVSCSCSGLNNCNGHGKCGMGSSCDCFSGWGASSDITTYRSPDCSARVCPSGLSWGDLPAYSSNPNQIVNHQPSECSDKGICNRKSGTCICSEGYEGKACEKMKCPNNCSGHGICMTLSRLARQRSARPLTDYIYHYDNYNVSFNNIMDELGSILRYHLICPDAGRFRIRLLGTQQRFAAVYVIHRGRSVSAPGKRRSRSGSDRTVPKVTESQCLLQTLLLL
jgi:hypothetical protein